MDRLYAPPSRYKSMLGKAYISFMDVLRHIRLNFLADEEWDGRDTLSFSLNGRKYFSLILGSGYFIFFEDGCEELRFEDEEGKLFVLIEKTGLPGRPSEDLSQAVTGKCWNRCDTCLIYAGNNSGHNNGSREFSERDWICYHTPDEDRTDYSGVVCGGCPSKTDGDCEAIRCAGEKGIESCRDCSGKCARDTHIADYDPAKCNMGMSSEDITRAVIPYCGRWRFGGGYREHGLI